ncbi:MAG TPA: hypothetical protein VK470_07670 [Bacteroidota bacterium]|nr:hypothetical protein [Bacteroidota bacterium]
MFEDLRKNIGMMIARVQGRRLRAKQINFRGIYTKARSALFIMPFDEAHRSIALSVVQHAQMQFKGNSMTILSSTETSHSIAGKLHQCMMVPVHEDQIGYFFLPKASLITRLRERTYDVIVDLNLGITPLAASVCAQLDVPLKAGFGSPQSETVYNLQLQTASARMPKLQYEQLVNTLAMF